MKLTISCWSCFLVVACVVSTFAAETKPTVTLQSRRAEGQTDRVVVLLEVGGDLKARPDGKQLQRTRMSGVDRLTYQETVIQTADDRLRALRYYEKAESSVKFKDDSLRSSLPSDRQLVGVAVDLPKATLFALGGPLQREELEVIDILGNSLLLDNLLPDKPAAVGDTWKPNDKLMAAILGLESVTRGDVQCKLTEVTDEVARIELAGRVEGRFSDTSARIQLRGKFRFDRRTNRIDWFALLSKENRTAGQVTDGFDVVVRLQMTINQQSPCEQLAKATKSHPNLEPTSEATQLGYQPPSSRWRVSHDRHWYLGSDSKDVAVLRRIDAGALLAQCNASALPKRDPDKLLSLAEFQADVREALGKNFGEFVEASETVNQAKHRILRVVVHGVSRDKSEELPIRWIYYHVADQQGRQAALTFTVQQEHVEQFADADKPVVDSLEFLEPLKNASVPRSGTTH
ncbi:MAG: hypothetical protein LLG00_09805 [Planctomycetaceae bacterium]|nr:hypothetical protein [Planctomycetaceae bacterium]